jgi:hypothetical protein
MFTISQATELSLARLGDPKRTGWRRGGLGDRGTGGQRGVRSSRVDTQCGRTVRSTLFLLFFLERSQKVGRGKEEEEEVRRGR